MVYSIPSSKDDCLEVAPDGFEQIQAENPFEPPVVRAEMYEEGRSCLESDGDDSEIVENQVMDFGGAGCNDDIEKLYLETIEQEKAEKEFCGAGDISGVALDGCADEPVGRFYEDHDGEDIPAG